MSRSIIGKWVKLTNPRTIHIKCTDGVSTIGFQLAAGSLGKVVRQEMVGEVASPIVRMKQPELALVLDVLCEPYAVEEDDS